MYKFIGGGILTWTELSKVLFKVETQINRRPLSYLIDDVELPTLTPSTFLFQRTSQLPEEKTWRIEKLDQHKRTKYLMNCENSLWRRWQREHLTALKEWHNLTHKAAKRQPNVAYVVIIKTKSKNCRSWPPAIVNKTYLAKDGIIHAVQLKTANGMLERPVQHLYPLELNSNQAWETQAGTPTADLNSNALVFRLRRDAAVAARAQIQHLAEDEQWITIPFLLNLKIVNLI